MLNDEAVFFPILALDHGHLALHLFETNSASILTPSTAMNIVETPIFPNVAS